MNLKIAFLSIFFAGNLTAQELPTNPQTGLVFIKDSVETTGKSLQEVKGLLSKWAYTLLDEANLTKIYKLDNSKQTEKISINLPLWSVLTQERGGNKYAISGTLTYNKTKTKGLVPTATFGAVKFDFSYIITTNKLIFEITNLEYSHDMVHNGKFEGEKPPSDKYNNSLLFKMSKKEWAAVKAEYFNKLKTLGENLMDYWGNILMSNQDIINKSPINYESYKKIATGMSYDDVVKLLVVEGKELSNGTTQIDGKTIIQQTIVWNDLDKSKSIIINFTDGKVSSKSQTNL